jgi:hypothetical protein
VPTRKVIVGEGSHHVLFDPADFARFPAIEWLRIQASLHHLVEQRTLTTKEEVRREACGASPTRSVRRSGIASLPASRPSRSRRTLVGIQVLPERHGLSRHSEKHFDAIAQQLNECPRQTLGWKTPFQALSEVVASTA